MKQILEDTTEAIRPYISKGYAHKIVITTHHKPDADALGSSLGLYHFLKNQGKEVTVVTPTDYPEFLHWMPGNDDVVNFDHSPDRAVYLASEADVIFCLDFNDLKRINKFGEFVAESKAIKVMVDHHRDPKGFDDYRLWTINTSSTAELIYDFIVKFGGSEALNSDMASCLYAGIMSDTGSFRFDSTTSQTHRAAADLIDHGAESAKIHALLLDNFTLNRFRLMGYVLYKKLEVLPELNTALVYLTAEEIKEFNIKTGDTEGFVNFGLSIEGVVFSTLIIDRTALVKMSFRSSGQFPCNEFASEHFDGGGHRNASGGVSHETLTEVVDRFKSVLPQYMDHLKS